MASKRTSTATKSEPKSDAAENAPLSESEHKAKTHHTSSSSYSPVTEKKKNPKTRIAVKYDVGFGNSLFIRGKGANLSWERGLKLTNVKPDEWIWETEVPFTHSEFKTLINDKVFETGGNHTVACGAEIQYTPRFD